MKLKIQWYRPKKILKRQLSPSEDTFESGKRGKIDS